VYLRHLTYTTLYSVEVKCLIDIGNNIKNIRKSKKMTQTDFAELMGLSRSYIGDLENNRSNPSIKTLEAIARALNVDLQKIISSDRTLNAKDNTLKIIEYTQLYNNKYLFKLAGTVTHKWNFIYANVDLSAINLKNKYYIFIECHTSPDSGDSSSDLKRATEFIKKFYSSKALQNVSREILEIIFSEQKDLLLGIQTVRIIWEGVQYLPSETLTIDIETN